MYTINPTLNKILAVCLVITTIVSFHVIVPPKIALAQQSGECNDGIDNDGDGAIDYPADSTCTNPTGDESVYVPSEPQVIIPAKTNDLGPTTYTFRVPGVYEVTVPAGAYKATVQTWGAGGGGGSGAKVQNHHLSGFGGGGGGYAKGEAAVIPGTKINVVVGTGGQHGEGGSMSEANVDQVAIAGAGGGGGGLSVGGPGYSAGNGGLIATIIAVIIIAVVTYFTFGAGSGVAGSLSTTLGSGSSAVVANGAVLTTAVQSAGVVEVTASGLNVMAAYTVSATTISAAGASAATTIASASAAGAVATGLSTGAIAGLTVAGSAARKASTIDPRKPGGINGIDGYGFGAVLGGIGAGKGGTWPTGSYGDASDAGTMNKSLNFVPKLISKTLAAVTFAKQAFAQAWMPVAGTGGDGYAGNTTLAGASGGAYSLVGGNTYASSGGAGANGGAGGNRGRRGQDGTGQGGYDVPLSGNAEQGGFPGGGGGGSDTGTGARGSDGQVVVDFSSDGVPPGNVPQCRDGINNDPSEDSWIDYPFDPGCTDVNDTTESPNPGDPGTNNAPSTPTLTCPATQVAGQQGTFTARSTDADAGDTLSYAFIWGDGGTQAVNGLSSGQNANASKTWATPGTKTINVTVTDSKGASASASASCQVNVTQAPPNTPTVSLTAAPASVAAGGAATLSWSSTYSDTCTASNGWSGSKAVSGTQSTGALNADTTYTLTCTGPNGSANASATVTLTSVPPGSTCNDPNATNNGAVATCTYAQCHDGVDNDGDGLIDYPADPGCANATDDSENDGGPGCTVNCGSGSGTYECSDKIDNDGNGLTDYPADPGCSSATDNSERSGGPSSAGFTLDGDPTTTVRFISSLGGDTDPKGLGVNPVGNFAQDVTVSLVSVTSKASGAPLPNGVTATATYSIDNGATFGPDVQELMRADGAGHYINSAGLIGLKVRIHFSKNITEPYYAVFKGVGGGGTDLHTLEIVPNGVNPDFREI